LRITSIRCSSSKRSTSVYRYASSSLNAPGVVSPMRTGAPSCAFSLKEPENIARK